LCEIDLQNRKRRSKMEEVRAAEREEKQRFWEEHLKSWETSGVTQNDYCRQNNLRLNRFIYWKRKRSSKRPATVSLVEWPIPRQAGSFLSLSAPLSVVIGSPYRIEIHKGFDPAVLEGVIRVLRGL
jgi:hypothetical protein